MFPFPVVPALSDMNVTLAANTNTYSYGATGLVSMPSDIVAGDIIVVCQVKTNSSTATDYNSYGTGFTRAHYVGNGSDGCMVASYKIADGTEGGTSIGGFISTSTGYEWANASVWRPSKSASTVAVQDKNSSGYTGGDPAPQTLNCSNSEYATIAFGLGYEATNPQLTWSPDTPQLDVRYKGGTADMEINASAFKRNEGVDVTVDLPNAGNTALISFYLEVY